MPDYLEKWPGEQESWVDEKLAPVGVPSRCDALDERLLAPPDDDNKPSDPKALHRQWIARELGAARRAVQAARALPDKARRGSVALLLWRVRVQGAQLALQMGDATPDRADAMRAEALDLLEPLGSKPAKGAAAPSSAELARMLFLRARLEVDAGDKHAALNDLDQALSLGPSGLHEPNAQRARLLAVELLTDAAKWDQALAHGDPMPARTSPIYAPFAYRLALAARQSGKEDRFLRIAMQALADRGAGQSPFLRAIYADVLELLATYNFDGRVVEMLENLGPRNRIYARVAALARVGLRRGHPANAAAACRWLLRHHRNYQYTPTYHGLLAVAAFLQDDEADFRKQVHAMTRRNPELVAALGPTDQATFFAGADRAFARLMGKMLPAMAEWGDGAAARHRRQRWLAIIVDETQRFLRSVDRSQVRPDLIELYGIASKLLADHPRGYAARVGQTKPGPLVLGTVEVARAELADKEPRVEPSMPAPYFLSLVPQGDAPAARWRFGWPSDAVDGKMTDGSTNGSEVGDD